MPSLPAIPSGSQPPQPLPPAQPTLAPLQSLLQSRGDSGWHLDLGRSEDKTQAQALLTGFHQTLAAQPELAAQLSQLPYGQALLESLEAAAQGQLGPQHVTALQRFLGDTAGIDIAYGGSDGVDGLLGPRTLAGLESFFARLSQPAETPASAPTAPDAAISTPQAAGNAYLSSLELSAKAPKTPVLTSLSLFDDNQPDGPIYERSPYHDETKFVPKFAMTAYHESGSYRSPSDPYAVGTITRPRQRDDLGGKTYGSYQFESSVYANGSNSGSSRVANSTLMRFLRWDGNAFGAELRAAAERHGVASRAFDELWTRLARQQNKAFGEAQQAFMLHERSKSVSDFMDQAQLSPEVRQDPRILDLIMGTTNHVGGLADSAADHLARLQRERGRKLTANEAGRALAEYKSARVTAWFQSSPGAWAGLRNRFADERSQFA